MRSLLLPLLAACLVPCCFSPQAAEPAEPVRLSEADWPWWRGPHRNGIAAADQDPPLSWSETKNVLWRQPIPGRGHGSATVVGDRVFLAAADRNLEQQMVLCFDRQSGDLLWETVVHEGGFGEKSNDKATLASSTPACDGERVFINFLHDESIYTTALDLQGNQLWQTKITDYVVHQGYGSSPAIYEDLVIVSADNKGGGAIAGLDRASGDVVWERPRPEKPNYASPIVLHIDGRDQLLLTGCDLVTSLDPKTGRELWETAGATTECVTSTVSDGKHIFTSGGYPKNHISAVAADGSGKVAWQKTVRAYVPSMLVKEGVLYAVLDAGIATCLESATGRPVWKERLGGTFSSSPIMVGERIYATNEDGATFVFRATPEGYEPLAKNQLGESVFATPTICGGRIYLRVAHRVDGRRQEFLYCLGRN